MKNYGISPGDHVGYWEILNQNGKFFTCRCICGTERIISAQDLLRGHSFSCGCRKGERYSKEQKAAIIKGLAIMDKIHKEKLSPNYLTAKPNKNSSTGIRGVSKKKGKYRAHIMIDHKQVHLGTFDTLAEAAEARKAGEIKYFSDRAEKVRKIKEEFHE